VSYTFTDRAPEAYQRELKFKGVGCTVEVKSETRKDHTQAHSEMTGEEKFLHESLIQSYFVEVESRKISISEINDFKYSKYEISNSSELIEPSYKGENRLFDPLVHACYSALARSSKISSYYISAFASIIRSMDLSNVDWNDNEKQWVDSPYPFRELMSDGSIKLLKEVPGFHLVLLTCFDQLYKSKQSDVPSRVENAAMTQLLRVPLCFRNLDRIPDVVISAPAREHLVELKLRAARASHSPKSKEPEKPKSAKSMPVDR
jgi:hypothetical protein